MFLAAAQSNTTVIIHHLSAINKDNESERGKKKVKTELLPFLGRPKRCLFFLGIVFIAVKSECIH